MPKRIQLKRTKGWRKPTNAVVVSRPSQWGNPFSVGRMEINSPLIRSLLGGQSHVVVNTVEEVVDLFRSWAKLKAMNNPRWLKPLAGKDLCCWCPLDQPCHADVLLDLSNR